MNSGPVRRQDRDLPASPARLDPEGDAVVIKAGDAAVGERGSEDVAGEIVEHGLFPVAPGRAVDHPGLGPGRRGHGLSQALSTAIEFSPFVAEQKSPGGLSVISRSDDQGVLFLGGRPLGLGGWGEVTWFGGRSDASSAWLRSL